MSIYPHLLDEEARYLRKTQARDKIHSSLSVQELLSRLDYLIPLYEAETRRIQDMARKENEELSGEGRVFYSAVSTQRSLDEMRKWQRVLLILPGEEKYPLDVEDALFFSLSTHSPIFEVPSKSRTIRARVRR
jgi:hypothetical protein